MDIKFIAAVVLFGPAALALPAIAVAWHRGQRGAAAERAAFRGVYARSAPGTGALPDVEPGSLATVTKLGPRRRLRAGTFSSL